MNHNVWYIESDRVSDMDFQAAEEETIKGKVELVEALETAIELESDGEEEDGNPKFDLVEAMVQILKNTGDFIMESKAAAGEIVEGMVGEVAEALEETFEEENSDSFIEIVEETESQRKTRDFLSPSSEAYPSLGFFDGIVDALRVAGMLTTQSEVAEEEDIPTSSDFLVISSCSATSDDVTAVAEEIVDAMETAGILQAESEKMLTQVWR